MDNVQEEIADFRTPKRLEMNYCKICDIPTAKKVAEPVEPLPDRKTVTAFIESLKDAEPARVRPRRNAGVRTDPRNLKRGSLIHVHCETGSRDQPYKWFSAMVQRANDGGTFKVKWDSTGEETEKWNPHRAQWKFCDELIQ